MNLRTFAKSIPVADIPAVRAWIADARREMDRRTVALNRAVTERLIPATGETIKALNRFSRALEREGEREYLRTHRRLPGSPRTARLRKKRVDRVMREFWNA